jgi:TRAP transporter 4TM/12TM fusion protein
MSGIVIALMKRSGFPAHIAGAIEAVGSTGGQLMPPVMGAAAFLMAEYLQVPYSEVMIAAALPAFLYYAALFIQVDLEAAKRGITGAPLERRPSLRRVLLDGWHFPIPFAILILGLVSWNLEPEYAALLATAVLVLFSVGFGYKGKRLSPKAAVIALVSAGGASLDMIVITAAAGLLIGVLNLTGLAFGLTLQLVAASGGSLAILLVATAAVGILLGMGMPTVGVYVILATLAAPALIQAGLAPMQAHMFVLYFGMMSMVTPPVALAAFAAANLAGADAWRTGWTATRVGWCAYIIPFLFAASPTLLLMGNPLDITLSAVTALLGVLMGAAGVVGHLRLPLSAPLRALFVAVGIALLVPVDAFVGAWLMNAAAFTVACVLLGRETIVKGELASGSA